MLLTQPRGCCQALRYCLLSPKVFNTLALPTAALLWEWMRLFPGQDFMNETDCVLQGKRLLCILQIKKKKKTVQRESTSQIQPWCGDRKSTLANDIFPESLPRKSRDKEWMLSTNPRSRQTQDKVDASMSTGAGGKAAAWCFISICNSKATAAGMAATTERQDQLLVIAWETWKSQLSLGCCDFRDQV